MDRDATGATMGADPSTHATKPAFVACFNACQITRAALSRAFDVFRFAPTHRSSRVFSDIKNELAYSTDRRYELSSSASCPNFTWNYPSNAFGDTSEMLRAGMAANPYMRVLAFNGCAIAAFSFSLRFDGAGCAAGQHDASAADDNRRYFDMATPFFGTEYTFAHLDLGIVDPFQRFLHSLPAPSHFVTTRWLAFEWRCWAAEPELRGNVTMAYYTAGHMFYTDASQLKKMTEDVRVFLAPSGAAKPRPVTNVPGREPGV